MPRSKPLDPKQIVARIRKDLEAAWPGAFSKADLDAVARVKSHTPPGAVDQANLSVRNADGKESTGEILLYDFIGFDYWTESGMDATRFEKAVKDLGDVDNIIVRVNSPGGDVFDAMAIYAILNRQDANVRIEIEGLAASAASFISMAGDEIAMWESASMMIHDAIGMVYGNAEDMRQTADVLEKLDGQIADIYASRAGRPVDDFRALMDDETWMNAEEASEHGLVDEVIKNKGGETEGGAENIITAATEHHVAEGASQATTDQIDRAAAGGDETVVALLEQPEGEQGAASIRARLIEIDGHDLDEAVATP